MIFLAKAIAVMTIIVGMLMTTSEMPAKECQETWTEINNGQEVGTHYAKPPREYIELVTAEGGVFIKGCE